MSQETQPEIWRFRRLCDRNGADLTLARNRHRIPMFYRMRYIVRREADGDRELRSASACCVSPAGGSPARVSAGAPGSRPPAGGEIRLSEAGCQKPLRREQVHGPQHQVKPAASTHLQSGSRAAYVTAKATSCAGDPEPAQGPGGVRGAARGQGGARNTRGPSVQPWSRQACPYKPKAKSGRAQRESEGIVVPWIAATNNAAGGKGPWGGCVVGAGKREGMAGKTGPNDPVGRVPSEKVRQPQRRLWTAAKQPSERVVSELENPSCGVTTLRRHRDDATRSCTMRRSERPPVSRVREIRMHGLNGGLVQISRSLAT